MKKKYVLLVFCTLVCNFSFSQQELDTTKCVFFLDNKKVYSKEIVKGYVNETIKWHFGTSSLRVILLKVGEKYRNYDDVRIYVTRKKDEMNEEN